MKCPWEGCGYIRKTTDIGPEYECPLCKKLYNRHPDYYGNNYFSIQLNYKEIPSDSEIKPGTLYLYLTNDEVVGAVLDNTGIVERIELLESDLGKNITEIKRTLSNPPSTLTSDQEAVICIATARKKTQQMDEVENPKEREEQKNKKIKLTVFSVGAVLIIIIFYYFLSDTTSTKTPPIEPLSPHTSTGDTAKRNNDTFLSAHGINLELITSKLDLADSLAKQCQNVCQSNHKSDESCVKTNEVLNEISPQISKYREYIQGMSVDRLSPNNKQLVEQINQQLWNIPQELESAKSACAHGVEVKTKTVISNPAIAPQKNEQIDFQSMDIHLDIIYSKVYAADANIRDCRMRCEAQSTDPTHKLDPTGCSIFLKMSKEYDPEIDQMIEVIKQQGRDKVSRDDNEKIRQIFYILNDIEKERQSLVGCLRAL